MLCHKVQLQLSAYIDAELSGHEMLSIREHLRSCPDCAEAERYERSTKSLLSSMKGLAPSDDLEKRLVDAILTKPREATERRRFGWKVVSCGLAAAAATIFFLRVQEWNSPEPQVTASNITNSATAVSHDQAAFSASDPIGGQAPLPVAYGNEETSR